MIMALLSVAIDLGKSSNEIIILNQGWCFRAFRLEQCQVCCEVRSRSAPVDLCHLLSHYHAHALDRNRLRNCFSNRIWYTGSWYTDILVLHTGMRDLLPASYSWNQWSQEPSPTSLRAASYGSARWQIWNSVFATNRLQEAPWLLGLEGYGSK
jgi:hypothetical protein